MQQLAFGFLATTAFLPWIAGSHAAPKWIVLALFGAAAYAFNRERMPVTVPVLLAGAWAAWCIIRIAPTYDGLNGAAVLAIAALLFHYGLTHSNLDRVWQGALVGVAVSSALAIPQYLGWQGLPQVVAPAGLFLNKNFLAEIAAVMLVIGLARGWWLSLLACAPAILLPASRGAFIALAVVGGWWLWQRSRWATAAVGCGAAAVIWQYIGAYPDAFTQRIDIWLNTASGIGWVGHGFGSFRDMYPLYAQLGDILTSRPINAHNDYLEMAFETGTIGLALFVVFGVSVRSAPLAAIGVIALFAFPLHQPATLMAGALLAGNAARCGVRVRWLYDLWRTAIRNRHWAEAAGLVGAGWLNIPAVVLPAARQDGLLHGDGGPTGAIPAAGMPRGWIAVRPAWRRHMAGDLSGGGTGW